MSKLYELYKNLKNQDANTVYLFKSGIFYISLQEDAKKLEKDFGFKITNFTPTVVKCGFPCSSLDKYSNLFHSKSLTFKIVENNYVYQLKDYCINRQTSNLISMIKNTDINSLSVSEAYGFIEKLQSFVMNEHLE